MVSYFLLFFSEFLMNLFKARTSTFALLLGIANGAPGDFPTQILNTEEFNNFVIDEKPYEG